MHFTSLLGRKILQFFHFMNQIWLSHMVHFQKMDWSLKRWKMVSSTQVSLLVSLIFSHVEIISVFLLRHYKKSNCYIELAISTWPKTPEKGAEAVSCESSVSVGMKSSKSLESSPSCSSESLGDWTPLSEYARAEDMMDEADSWSSSDSEMFDSRPASLASFWLLAFATMEANEGLKLRGSDVERLTPEKEKCAVDGCKLAETACLKYE